MKAGIILSKGFTLKSGLSIYTAVLRFESGTTFDLGQHLHLNAPDALQQFLGKKMPDCIVSWLSGPAATRKLAKEFGLEFRKRAPGAGRKRVKDPVKPAPIRLNGAEMCDLRVLAKHHKGSPSKWVRTKIADEKKTLPHLFA